MKGKWIVLSTLSISLLLAGLLLAGVTRAVVNAPSTDWWTIGGGGGSDTAGNTTLDATVGQAVVGLDSNGTRKLCAGFWCGTAVEYRIYLPIVLRNS